MPASVRLALVVLLVPAFVAWHGFVTSVLWGWFVVPLGVPAVGVWHACGLRLVVFMLTEVPTADPLKDSLKAVERAVFRLVAPAFALGMGYVYQVLQ